MAGHEHTRFLSPNTSTKCTTVGQNLLAAIQGAGNAAAACDKASPNLRTAPIKASGNAAVAHEELIANQKLICSVVKVLPS